MHEPNTSQLSLMIPSQQNSLLYSQPPQHHEHLLLLKSQLADLSRIFMLFKDDTMSYVRHSMGRMANMLYKSVRDKGALQNQLQKSRQVQNTMRSEVIQLKDMINQAMIDYAKDLQAKDRQISSLRQQLQLCKEASTQSEVLAQVEEIKIEESKPTNREEQLQIIQEQSSHATYSSVTSSLQEFREEEREVEEQVSIIPESHYIPEQIQEVSLPDCIQDLNQFQQSKTKSFIDRFRKNVGDSHVDKTIDKQNFQVKNRGINVADSYAQPLREVSNIAGRELQNRYYTNQLKIAVPKTNFTKTIYLHTDSGSSLGQSEIDDSSKVSGIEQESEINPIKKLETPTSLFKKKQSNQPILTHQRVKTEPSLDNSYFPSSKTVQQKQDKRQICDRSFSDCKSIKTSTSKEKIKVTSRMVDDVGYLHKRNHTANSAKAVVYLGGKAQFRKFLLELKQAFRRYCVNQTSEQVNYERGRGRCGRGSILLRNGMVYEGQLKDGMRHGRGSLLLNGISIYEGEWYQDRLHGEGYIKSMRCMSGSCPSLFSEASYCGNMHDNKFQGIGTIFLNQKEKIVTKFSGGCPVGELTYYNLHEIQFGVWPSE